METSLTHLPERKQGELSRIVKTILRMAPDTEMIILFGSYARGDAVEDVTVDGHITYEYASDFDILVIVKSETLAQNTGFWYDVETKASKLPVQTPLTLIVHDIKYVNAQLEKGQYFFSDIKKEGVLLYDSRNCRLADAKPMTSEQRRGYAQANFDEYFQSATEFYGLHETSIEKKWYNKAAFLLHQATETFFKTLLLVYTNYKPKTHQLNKLAKMASSHDPDFLKIFPMATEEQQRCFDLLKRAYVEARYNPGYKITAEELSYLAERVQLLRDLTQSSCQKRIKTFI